MRVIATVFVFGALLGSVPVTAAQQFEAAPAPVAYYNEASVTASTSAFSPYAGDEATGQVYDPALDCGAGCCSPRELVVGYGYDSWRGIQDGDWTNNGMHATINFGTRLGWLSDYTGIGAQVGAQVGVYDWSGALYRWQNWNVAETQGFLTFGLFRRPTENCRLSGALVNDWMFTDAFGLFSENPTLGQLRWQIGYGLNPQNEIGFWGTAVCQGDSRDVPFLGTVVWQPKGQYNVYFRHVWESTGADTTMFVGLPEGGRLMGSGDLGSYIAGASATAPLGERIGLYTLVTYMHPAQGANVPGASFDEAWQFMIGLSYTFGGSARTHSLTDHAWAPLLPVANNGYFLVDTNETY